MVSGEKCDGNFVYVSDYFHFIHGVAQILHDDEESGMVYGAKGILEVYICEVYIFVGKYGVF